jgi:hypothetical protein
LAVIRGRRNVWLTERECLRPDCGQGSDGGRLIEGGAVVDRKHLRITDGERCLAINVGKGEVKEGAVIVRTIVHSVTHRVKPSIEEG